MTRESFKENDIFSMKKIVDSTLDLFHKSSFLIGQLSIEKYGLKTTLFLLFNI